MNLKGMSLLRLTTSSQADQNKPVVQSGELYKAIFEYSKDGIFVCEFTSDWASSPFVEVNDRFSKQTGYAKTELLLMTPSDLLELPYAATYEIHDKLVKNKQALFEVDYRKKSGQKMPAELKIHIFELNGQTMMVGIGQDISSRKKVQAHNRALINAIPDMMFRISKDGIVLQVKNGREANVLSAASEVVGKSIFEILPRRVADLTAYHTEQALNTKQLQTYEYEMAIQRNKLVWEVRLVNCGTDEVLAIVRDITERKRQEKRLKYLSLHDSLTGIFNRAYIEQEMHRIQTSVKGPIGVVMCDVDRLKQVNDTMGHSSGDSLLVAAANVIKKAVRKGDIVARIGGDEFAILLQQGDMDAAKSIYARIEDEVSRHNNANPKFPISMSVGYAVSNDQSMSMAELLKEADYNMYREKMRRNSIRIAE